MTDEGRPADRVRVGLTGGIGSGKSEVSRALAGHGAVVIDADVLAREVVSAGTEGLAEVVHAFGPGVLSDDGSLDRPTLGRRVFGDAQARGRLEAIIHPRVRARASELEAAAAADDAVVVHDIPLLVETGQVGDFDVVLVVDVSPDVQLDRLTRVRGMSIEEAQDRVAAQATREQRLAVADHVLDNSGTLAALHGQVDALWRRLVETG